MLRRLVAVLSVCGLLALNAAPAAARDDVARRDALLSLAFTLGQSHALARACTPDDQTWRARMRRMIELEAPDRAFEGRLAARFNDGYAGARAAHPVCSDAGRRALAAAAREGERLSRSLSSGG